MEVTSRSSPAWLENFDLDGFAIIEGVETPARVRALVEATQAYLTAGHKGAIERAGSVYGGRDLLWRIAEVRRLSRSPELLEIAQAVLGPGSFAVRGLYFDKTPAANWNLPWHQDLTIAVQARREVPGFGPWTLKAGIPHVHAPAELLAQMVTIRLHLDDCRLENGPLRVLPGSHAAGKLDAGAVLAWAARAQELAVNCLVPAGGVVVMRPLLLHASASGTNPGHRRVIHLEYAALSLPGGLEWYEGTQANAVATIP